MEESPFPKFHLYDNPLPIEVELKTTSTGTKQIELGCLLKLEVGLVLTFIVLVIESLQPRISVTNFID